MPHLFEPITIRHVRFANRIGVSPMCQYSAASDGFATDYHLVHLGARALGGAGLAIVEATAVEARGRISPADLGLWHDGQIEPLAKIARFLERHGTVAGIQLAHAGRKGSTSAPWLGSLPLANSEGGWELIGPSEIPFDASKRTPSALSRAQLVELRGAFRAAAIRAKLAGFRLLELHGAHGYLLHSFLSPISNLRSDEYGGSFDQRIRFVIEIIREVREIWPTDRVLAIRLSCSDWSEGGWTPEETVELAKRLQYEGVDLVDCSSGGSTPSARIPVGPGYQVGFAEAVKRQTLLKTAAVGLITDAAQADEIITSGRADLVLLGRELLRNPQWPLEAARALGKEPAIPPQYARAFM